MKLRALLAAALLAVPASAHADWYEASTSHFVIYSEQKPERLKKFATELERFDKLARFFYSARDAPVGPANRLTIYVVDDTSDVAQLAGSDTVAGFYRPRAGGSLAIVPRNSGGAEANDLSAQQILLHEYAHHLTWSLYPNIVFPSWYIEGSAELLATTRYDKDGSMVIGLPPQYRSYSLMEGNWLPVDKMMVADTLKLDERQREGLYGRGWLLNHYLMFGDKRKGQLVAYLRALNSGTPPKDAATTAFGDLKQLDRELEKYKLGSLVARRAGAELTQVGDVTIRPLTAGEAATMDVRIRSKNGVTAKTAPGVYAAAKKAAAPYPNDAGAQLVLAEAAYDVGDYATSEAAADRAIAANPKAVDGYVYKAMCRMALATKAKDFSKESWSVIRKAIVAGNRIDPQDPEPLILYYRSYLEQGVPVPAMAKDGLYDAFIYAPQDTGLRLNTATMLLRDGDTVRARELLAPLAYQPHGKGLAELAAQLLAKIDAKDIDGAITLLDGDRRKDGNHD
jgi:tetratricopeptide (TPR) repeat protein